MAIAQALGVVLLFPAVSPAPQFTGGPSVRVSPNNQVEFKWITDVSWFGEFLVFDNPDGTGTPVTGLRDEDAVGNPIPSTQHTLTLPLSLGLAPDTGYFFKVTATDPNNSLPPFSTPTPLPPFFTGAQTIDVVSAQPGIDSALISWEANVIGFGKVDYGLTEPGDVGTLTDSLNITDHTIELTGLLPETTYVFRVSNLHAIDGDALVSRPALRSGEVLSFTTLAVPEPSALVVWVGLNLVGILFRRLRRHR
jgi:hypothetical protein